jgi:hypothetical protein
MLLRFPILSLAIGLAPAWSLADIVELKSGGRVEGKVNSNDRNSFLIELADGGKLTVDRGQVARVVTVTPDDEAYRRRAPATADTVAAQWELAMWCRDQKLKAELERHLQRVVELDPTHEEARQLLGYREVNGQWLTSDEIMQSRGLVLYEGKYYTTQDIELFERNKLVKDKEFAWKANIERWRKWLDDRDGARVAEARQQFRSLRDPMAASNLVRVLEKEKNEAVRLLLIEAAARIPSQLTLEALVKISLEDESEELRLQALEYLVEGGGSRAVPVYIKALKSNDNAIVNRAAVALGSLGDTGAMGPLIDALITEHKRIVGNPSQGDTYSLSPSDGSFGFGGGGPKVLKGELRNPDVRSALVKLAGGADFDFDADAWRAWLGARNKIQTANLRRDE